MLSRRSRGGGGDPAAEEVGLAAADTDREQRIRTKEQQQQQQQQPGDRDSTAQQSRSLFKRTKKLFGGRSPGGKMMPPTKGGDGEGGGDGPRTHTATRTSRPTGNTTSSMGKGRKGSAPAQLQPALVPGAYAVSTAADDAAAAAAAGALATATATAETEAMTADADADAKAPALVVREDSVLVGPELPVEVDHIQHNEDDARAQARAYLAEEEECQRVLALSEASPSVPHAQHDGAANDDDDDDDEIALAIKLSLQEQQQQRPPASPPSTRDNDSDSPENYKLPAAAAAPREVKRLPVPLTVEEADPASISTEEPAVDTAVRIKSYDQLRARRLKILQNLEGSPLSPLLLRDPPVTSWNDAGTSSRSSRSSGLHVPAKYFRDYGIGSNAKGGGGATRTCSDGGIGSDATCTNTTKSTTSTTLSPKDICSMLQTALEVSALPLPEETTTSAAADRHRHHNVRLSSLSSALSRIVQTDEVRAAETRHVTEVAKIRDEGRDDLLLSLLSEAGGQSSLLRSVDNPEGGGAPAPADVERRERRAIGDALLAVSAAADRRRGEDAGLLRSARSRAE